MLTGRGTGEGRTLPFHLPATLPRRELACSRFASLAARLFSLRSWRRILRAFRRAFSWLRFPSACSRRWRSYILLLRAMVMVDTR